MLNTDEVLSVWSVLWNGGLNPIAAPCAPSVGGEIFAAAADTFLEDFEPITGSVVVGGIVTWSTGHVNKSWTWVLHGGTNTETEADVVTSIDSQSLTGTALACALVTSDIWSIGVRVVADVGGRVGRELDWVVCNGTSRPSDVLELGLSSTVDDVGVEEVMC